MKTMALLVGSFAGSHASEYFTGDGTTYTLGQTSAGNCNMMAALAFATTEYAALNNDQWDGLQNCGRCAKVSCADDRCADQSSSVVVQILDRCPECKHGDLDLSPSVFTALTGSSPSRYRIKWHFVDCPVSGNLNYCLKAGSNTYWMGVQPTNSATGVQSLTINGQATTMLGSAYYYLLDGAHQTQTDLTRLTIAVTDVHGSAIQETVSLAPDQCTKGSHQFPSGLASSPTMQQTEPIAAVATRAPTPHPTVPPPTPHPTVPPPTPHTTTAPIATPDSVAHALPAIGTLAPAPSNLQQEILPSTVPLSPPPTTVPTTYPPPTTVPTTYPPTTYPPTTYPPTTYPPTTYPPTTYPPTTYAPTTYPPTTYAPLTTGSTVPMAPSTVAPLSPTPLTTDLPTFSPVTITLETLPLTSQDSNAVVDKTGPVEPETLTAFHASAAVKMPSSSPAGIASVSNVEPTQRPADVSAPPSRASFNEEEQTEPQPVADLEGHGVQTVSTRTRASSGGTDPLLIVLSTLGGLGVVALLVVVVMARRRNIREEKVRDRDARSVASVQSFGVHHTPCDSRQALAGIL